MLKQKYHHLHQVQQQLAKLHSYRVHHQVQTWLGNIMLNPLDWGWNVSDDVMYPRRPMTDMTPAPDNLLKMVKFNCKTDCRTTRCSYKKNELDCSYACGECQGTECFNSRVTQEDDSEEEL